MKHALGFLKLTTMTALHVLVVASFAVAQIAPVSVPPDFFEYTITGNGEVSEGYYYMDLFSADWMTTEGIYYLAVMDEEGDIQYYIREEETSLAMFEAFPEANKFVYCRGSQFTPENVYILDETYIPVDSLNSFDDLAIDAHEVLIRPDGSYWALYWRDYETDMSEVIEGGLEDAIVRAHVVLHLDADHNILWEWDSYDHLDELPFSDIDNQDLLLNEEFEHIHTNAIEIDFDGNILLSNRYMSEVIKVKVGAGDGYEDGDVMWRFGGGSGNQFTFIDDLDHEGFKGQHDIRRLPNGNVTLFDNGMLHDPPTAYGREYALDMENMTATLVWSYRDEAETFGAFATGSTRRLENGNTLIGWGYGTPIGATEVTPENEIAWQFVPEASIGNGVFSYRYTKSTMLGTAAVPYITAIEGDGEVSLYLNFFGHDDIASYNVTYVNESTTEETTFNVEDNVTLISGLENGTTYTMYVTSVNLDDEESERSNSIHVTPTLNAVGEEDRVIMPAGFVLQGNYPNPFNPSTTIRLTMNQPGAMEIAVYDILGRQVTMLKNGTLSAGDHTFTFHPDHLASGVYVVRAQSEDGATQAHRMVYLR